MKMGTLVGQGHSCERLPRRGANTGRIARTEHQPKAIEPSGIALGDAIRNPIAKSRCQRCAIHFRHGANEQPMSDLDANRQRTAGQGLDALVDRSEHRVLTGTAESFAYEALYGFGFCHGFLPVRSLKHNRTRDGAIAGRRGVDIARSQEAALRDGDGQFGARSQLEVSRRRRGLGLSVSLHVF